jgi:hypothetical protein
MNAEMPMIAKMQSVIPDRIFLHYCCHHHLDCCGLGPLTSFLLDLDDALGLAISVLVSPYHYIRSDDTERPNVG